MDSPRAIAVLSAGDSPVVGPLRASSAALGFLGLVLHHLPLVQGMVEAEVHRLQQQEHGGDDSAVDSHDRHGWFQGLAFRKEAGVSLEYLILQKELDCTLSVVSSNFAHFLWYFNFLGIEMFLDNISVSSHSMFL